MNSIQVNSKSDIHQNLYINENLELINLNESNIVNSNDSNILNSNKEGLILKKKKLIDNIKNLSNIEYIEIFNIFQEDNCSYSDNNNGVFINLTNIGEETIDKIFNFINFIKKKKKELSDKENYLENMKKDISEQESNKSNTEQYTTKNNVVYQELSDNEEEINFENYLCFSSDEEDDLENKLSLKKKKIKYSGKKAKLIKSIKENNEKNK